jgi:hypothetical protein
MAARVKAPCVQRAIRSASSGGADTDALDRIAERAGRTRRTIDRNLEYGPEHEFSLADADRLLTAAGGHLDLDCPDDIIE